MTDQPDNRHQRSRPVIHYILMAVVAAAAIASGRFFLNAFWHLEGLEAQTSRMSARVRMIKRQAIELNQKVKIIQRVQQFMDEARQRSMTPDQWSVYEVDLQGGVTFAELARIVEQCDSRSGIYFQPAFFHVQSLTTDDPDQSRPEAVSSLPAAAQHDAADGPAPESGDVRLSLRGAFVVRQ